MKLQALLGLALGSVLALAGQVQATLYGATASGAAGNLYVLDPTNGSVIQNVGPTNDSLATNYPITGLAVHPITGVLYGSTGNNPSATAALLLTIDPVTALVTVIGSYNAGPTNTGGTPATMTDLAFDAAGNLYGIGSIGGPQLYSINTATAQATVIGTTGLTSTTGGGLDINLSGQAYGTPTASRFGTYDLVTGAYTNIADPVKPGGGAYAALAFDENGVLYGLNSASGSPPPTFLVIIDPATGAVTSLGGSVTSLDAIAFTVPEPGSVAILLVSGCIAMTRRRH